MTTTGTRTSPATRTEAPGVNPLLEAWERMATAWRFLKPDMTPDDREGVAQALWFGMQDIEAALEVPTLDEAWRQAEAALPDGWGLDVGDSIGHPAGKYEASAEPPRGNDGRAAYGPTPAAALQALRDKLVAG